MFQPKLFLVFLILSSFSLNAQNQENEEWISLFNGHDLTGWDIKIADNELGLNLYETFVVEDSMIRIRYNNYSEFNDAFGHMYYKTPFSYYKLSFDYRFVGEQLKGGSTWNVRNSGIMLHSQSASSNEFTQHFPVSVELQLLGGLNEGDRTTANVCTPGTTLEMDGELNHKHCISSTSKTYKGDQWVHCEAIVLGGESMTFVVEGDTVLYLEKPQVGGGLNFEKYGMDRDRQLWTSKEGMILTEGYIALQAESHPIDFKNIKLLNLCGCTDTKAKNYKPYYKKNVKSDCKY